MKYLQGDGIEIGALHNPMLIDLKKSRVRYVDEKGVEELRKIYPEIKNYKIVEPDIIGTAENLSTIPDETQDFLIANHLLEHVENPIGALKEWYRVLKHGGLLFMAVPDMRKTFDKDRPVTTLQHIIGDYEKGGEYSRREHLVEWCKCILGLSDPATINIKCQELEKEAYRIHYHVWTVNEVKELINYITYKMGWEWEVIKIGNTMPWGNEFLFLLRKV